MISVVASLINLLSSSFYQFCCSALPADKHADEPLLQEVRQDQEDRALHLQLQAWRLVNLEVLVLPN